jgi:hypothetical protein
MRILTSEELRRGKACSLCGAPATNGGEDLKEVAPINGTRQFELCRHEFFGCDAHPVPVRCFNLDGSVTFTPTDGREFTGHHGSTLLVFRGVRPQAAAGSI